tara:strand:+ start:15697 stop:16017 length:321 start_codon:yes stop_codon:yes gene_type:complete
MSNSTTIHIESIDGTKHAFSMPAPQEGAVEYTVGSRIERFLNQQSVALSVDGELLVIPMHQIKSLRIGPIRSKLPESVVATVTRINDDAPEMMAANNSTAHQRKSA